MVLGVFGLPGAGKTTFLTKCAVKSLSGKRFMRRKPHKPFTQIQTWIYFAPFVYLLIYF